MSYSGLGFRPMSTIQKPKRVFKSVFEQLRDGEHPISSKNTRFEERWAQVRQHIDNNERNENDLTIRIYMAITIATLVAFIITAM